MNDQAPRKKAVIKDIDYDLPESGDLHIWLKAYDKGLHLAGKQNQKVGRRPEPGIRYSRSPRRSPPTNPPPQYQPLRQGRQSPAYSYANVPGQDDFLGRRPQSRPRPTLPCQPTSTRTTCDGLPAAPERRAARGAPASSWTCAIGSRGARVRRSVVSCALRGLIPMSERCF